MFPRGEYVNHTLIRILGYVYYHSYMNNETFRVREQLHNFNTGSYLSLYM